MKSSEKDNLQVYLGPEEKRNLKMLCVAADVTMSDAVGFALAGLDKKYTLKNANAFGEAVRKWKEDTPKE
jgi:hypothetical protein